ncbi:uncharacterized protein VTP21DRAFT_6577 [Calcarisporiella thermophila]|uniref:uncharacterized protein n=1 Tax=Calcarisporiella thermophila TaxID=911321 RepID=UPI003742B4E0
MSHVVNPPTPAHQLHLSQDQSSSPLMDSALRSSPSSEKGSTKSLNQKSAKVKSFDNIKYKSQGGNVKVQSIKLDWSHVKPRIDSRRTDDGSVQTSPETSPRQSSRSQSKASTRAERPPAPFSQKLDWSHVKPKVDARLSGDLLTQRASKASPAADANEIEKKLAKRRHSNIVSPAKKLPDWSHVKSKVGSIRSEGGLQKKDEPEESAEKKSSKRNSLIRARRRHTVMIPSIATGQKLDWSHIKSKVGSIRSEEEMAASAKSSGDRKPSKRASADNRRHTFQPLPGQKLDFSHVKSRIGSLRSEEERKREEEVAKKAARRHTIAPSNTKLDFSHVKSKVGSLPPMARSRTSSLTSRSSGTADSSSRGRRSMPPPPAQKLDWSHIKSKVGSLDNITYVSHGGTKKIQNNKLPDFSHVNSKVESGKRESSSIAPQSPISPQATPSNMESEVAEPKLPPQTPKTEEIPDGEHTEAAPL